MVELCLELPRVAPVDLVLDRRLLGEQRVEVGVGLGLVVAAIPASAAPLPILASQDLWPVFAPDGRHVAFTRVNGQGRVFTLEVVDAQTGRTVAIGQNQGQLSPSWSSDGRIAYA